MTKEFTSIGQELAPLEAKIKDIAAKCDKKKTSGLCPKCDGLGFIYKRNELGDDSAYKCDCLLQQENLKRIELSGLSTLLKTCTFDTYLERNPFQKAVKTKAYQFINQNQYKSFFIGGQVGCGKTHICTAISKEYLDNCYPVRYAMYREMIAEIKALSGIDKAEEYRLYTDNLKAVKVLYIDDLFKTKKGSDIPEADIRHLYQIINHRYINNMVTLYSSEMKLADIINVDEAIGSRIKQMCGNDFNISVSEDIAKNYRLRECS